MPELLKYYSPGRIEAGVDEAGRGCLAGPVVAAAVIFPKEYECEGLNDSKQLTEKQRDKLEVMIRATALSFGIGVVDNEVIDEINILQASFQAMNIAISKLFPVPDLLLIDGNRFKPTYNIEYKCIVKGDGKIESIAAASILAKTYRDRLMRELDKKYPQYLWHQNKGYPTPEHKRAILASGITSLHRKSFRLYDNEKQLDLVFK